MGILRRAFYFLHAALILSSTVAGQLYRNNNRLNYRQYSALSGRFGSHYPRYRSSYRAALAGNNVRLAGTRRPSQSSHLGGNLHRNPNGYANYLRQLNNGYYPPDQPQSNSVFSYSSYKTGFPLRAPLPGYSSGHSPLPLSAPSLYGYGGYQTDRWGQWSSWSHCSRSCNGGVQERTRNCLSAKLSMTLSLYRDQGHSQGNCPGFGKEFQPCNTSPCVSVKSFEDQKFEARETQCSRFDNKEYLGQKYTWMPYLRDGLNECRLYCMAKGFRMFVELANRVDDGTPCGKSGIKACFSGICSRGKPPKSPDRPVSQNDDHSKRLGQSHLPHSGRIGSQLGQVPNQRAPFVPHGTAGGQHQRPFFPPSYGQPNQNRNFPSRGQFPRRGHRPQISSNPSLRALHGQQRDYFLNRGNFPGSDKVVNADRKYGKPKSVRRIISGRFNSREKLKLGYNPIFKIPVGARNIRVEEVRPSANYLALKVGDDYLVNGRWSIALKKDVKAAGTLIKYSLGKGPNSVETLTAVGPTNKELQIVLLYQQGPPDISFNYTLDALQSPRGGVFRAAAASGGADSGSNVRGRKARPTLHWSVEGWTKCSKPCGGGEQSLIIRCVAIYPSKRTKIVKSSYCHALQKPPRKRRMCNLHPCKAGWVLLPWKPCSKTCGEGGFQTRDVRCVRVILTERGKVEVNAPFYECGPRPAIQKPCQFVPCYAWKSDPWSECSRSCDKGVQTRKSYCTGGSGVVEENLCDSRRKPEHARVCNLRPCKASWFIGDWSECSEFCGKGFENRLVFCAGKDGSAMSESFCQHQVKPKTKRACMIKKCDGIWFTSNWTQCSSQCGAGRHSRMVLCLSKVNGSMHQVAESHCDLTNKPADTKACDAGPCSPKWFATEWSHCSRSCGRGIRTRQINCMLKNGQFGRGCQVEKRPNSAMICYVRQCENLIEGETTVAPTTERVSHDVTEPVSKADNHRTIYTEANEEAKEASEIESNGRLDKNKQPVLVTVSPVQSSIPEEEKNTSDNFAAAETEVVLPLAKYFRKPTTAVKTTVRTTTKLTTAATTTVAATTKAASVCKNTFKRAYCSVILRIGFCKFTTYRKRCCFSCETASIR